MAKPLRRVLRSDDLPAPAQAAGSDAPLLRDRATAGTVVRPVFREIDVDGALVLLTRLTSGEVVAIAGYCPHQGTALRSAATIAEGHIRCEQHKFVYDARTGRNILPSRDASPAALARLKPGYLPTYPVEERDGWVWIDPRPRPAPDEDAPLPPPAFSAPSRAAARTEKPATAPVDQPPETVEVAAGESFSLDLHTSPRPTHMWRLEVDGDAVEVVGQGFEERDDGLHYWVEAVARGAGAAELRCIYAKPWGEPSETRTFTVKVDAR